MKHAFLIHEGVWTATGQYFDASNRGFPARGRMRVVHGPAFWSLQTTLSVAYPERPLEHSNRYDFLPLPPGASLTTWTSENSALGRIKGRIAFVDDAILSEFTSLDGESSGQECMVGGANGSYLNRGLILRNGELLASWSLNVRLWGPGG